MCRYRMSVLPFLTLQVALAILGPTDSSANPAFLVLSGLIALSAAAALCFSKSRREVDTDPSGPEYFDIGAAAPFSGTTQLVPDQKATMFQLK